MESSAEDGTGEDLLQQLQDDVRTKTIICMERLPQDIYAKQQRLEQVQKVMNAPDVTDIDLENMTRENQSLSNEIAELQVNRPWPCPAVSPTLPVGVPNPHSRRPQSSQSQSQL